LIAAFEARGIFALHVTRWDDESWRAILETTDQHEAPEPNIAAIVAVVESLTDANRDLWFGCSRREFNIGYECGNEPGLNHAISTELLARVASIHASLGFTIYSSQTT
jgi:hypothetical protein